MDGFSILDRLADITGGNVLHGGSVTVKLLSEETVRKYYDGKALRKASFSLSVYGKDQEDVLGRAAAAVSAASGISGIFAFKICGAQGDYTDRGNYLYTVKISCRYFYDGGDVL